MALVRELEAGGSVWLVDSVVWRQQHGVHICGLCSPEEEEESLSSQESIPWLSGYFCHRDQLSWFWRFQDMPFLFLGSPGAEEEILFPPVSTSWAADFLSLRDYLPRVLGFGGLMALFRCSRVEEDEPLFPLVSSSWEYEVLSRRDLLQDVGFRAGTLWFWTQNHRPDQHLAWGHLCGG